MQIFSDSKASNAIANKPRSNFPTIVLSEFWLLEALHQYTNNYFASNLSVSYANRMS